MRKKVLDPAAFRQELVAMLPNAQVPPTRKEGEMAASLPPKEPKLVALPPRTNIGANI